MKLQRYDKAYIKDWMETPEGYLTVNVPITRPGVFPYQRQDGTVQMEAKLPEEIFNDRVLYTARSKPVTDGHPNEPVTVDNYQTYAKGMSHTDSRVEDLKVYISLTVTDKGLIQKIFDGYNEISIGFMSEVVAESGTYDGQNYEYVQRNIEINHIAVVEKGRAGPEVAIRADSDAWQVDSQDEPEGSKKEMAKIKIKDTEYEVDETVKAHITALEKKVNEKGNEKEKDTKGDAADAFLGRLDAMQAQLDAKEAELAAEKAKQLTGDALDKLVAERVELISTAKPLLGDSFDFIGKSDRDIKEAVIATTKQDFKGDGKSDDYINAYFDSMVSQVQAQGFPSTGANSAYTGDAADDKSLQEMKNQRLNMRK